MALRSPSEPPPAWVLDGIARTLGWDGVEVVLMKPGDGYELKPLYAPWWFRWAVRRWPRLWVLVPQRRVRDAQ